MSLLTLSLSETLNKNTLDKISNSLTCVTQLVTVKVPKYLDEEKLRKVLLDTYDIEIGAGLGKLAGKVFRIGVMGNGARIENMQRLLSALSEVLVQDFVSIKCKTEAFG